MANNVPKASAAQVDAAIAADAGRSGQAFVADISAWVAKAKGSLDQIVRGVAIDLGKSVIERTPVDTGRAKGSWRISANAPDTSTMSEAEASALDGEPKTDARKAAGNREGMKNIDEGAGKIKGDIPRSIFITNALPYIKRLEYGWSVKQAPEGMVRITAAEFQKIVQEKAAFVRSGGKE